ncbi:455_t:CDS:2 [Racocetra fulgida]|uniref:455_t:CDS:1 n=1 Tax=Racocetra fulgida TaxID=60492 RepID=A0A9N8WB81_9GLOM|nr:455_t:CDS:2 [Racocetra fulgida]
MLIVKIIYLNKINKEQTELDDYYEDTFSDDVNDILDINEEDSFSQVLESSPKTVNHFGQPVCHKYRQVYENSTGVFTLRAHLKKQQIKAPKKSKLHFISIGLILTINKNNKSKIKN